MPLETLANVKAALQLTGTADDALLTWAMDAAESYIEQHCGRAFGGGTFTETHPAGGSVLFLRNFPVASVTSLRVDSARLFGTETARAASAYIVHADRGVVESADGPFLAPRGGRAATDWPGAVQVVYATPTGAVPAAVRDAFTRLVLQWLRQAKTNADQGCVHLTETSDGTTTKSYPWALTNGLKVPPGVTQLLAAFRVPAV